MSQLQIEPLFGPGESAVVELVDTDLEVRQGHVTADDRVSFDVSQGSYLLRAKWSDGQQSQQVVNVTGDLDQKVSIMPPAGEAAETESDSFAFSQRLRPIAPPMEIGGKHVDWLETPPHVTDEGLEPLLQGQGLIKGTGFPQVALWRKTNGTWMSVSLPDDPTSIEYGEEYDLMLDDALHLFEVNTGNFRQFISLPAERSVVSVRSIGIGSSVYSRADARTADRDVEVLRGQIQRGEFDVARLAAPEVMAERYLRSKMAAPRIAALGAYFLLRVGDLERLHDWPDNLTNWKSWLPDGPVIAAWQRLRSKDPNYDEIFGLFKEALRRGLPVYTEGVRLMKDGLDLFASDTEQSWDVQDELGWLSGYAKAMDWGRSETTFFGKAPDTPSAHQT